MRLGGGEKKAGVEERVNYIIFWRELLRFYYDAIKS